MPMPPPAPALFSMTTGWPSARPIASATGRPTVSATPPGGNGTTIVTGRSGYCAFAAAAIISAAQNAATRLIPMSSSSSARAVDRAPDHVHAERQPAHASAAQPARNATPPAGVTAPSPRTPVSASA